MSCPSELTWCEYADGELPESQARDLDAHLALCPVCRALSTSLEQENALLRGLLSEAQTRATASAPGTWAFLAAALALLAPAMLQALWQATPSLPSGLAWLKSLGGVGGFWALSKGLFGWLFGGEEMLVSLLGFVATLTVALGALALPRIRRVVPLAANAGALLSVLGGLLSPAPALAADVRSEEGGTVEVGADEVVDDSVVLYGETALVAGIVEGDLFVAAERVEVTGTVRGNVYAAAETLTVTGQVGGTLHAVGENLELNAPVGRSAFMAGENVVLGEKGTLTYGGVLGGESVRVKGHSGRDLYFGAGRFELLGSVERDLHGWTSDFAMSSSSLVGRDLQVTVTSEDAAQIDQGARIGGETQIEVDAHEQPRAFLHAGFYFLVLAKVAALLLLGFVAVTLFPALRPDMPADGGQVLRQMGIGFVVLVATPVAGLIVALTVIGLPLALLLLVAYALLLYTSTLVVASFAAQRLPAPHNLALRTLLVLLALSFAVEIPLVGPGLGFLVVLLGVGALTTHLWSSYAARR